MKIPERINFDRVAHIYDETRVIPEPLFTKGLDAMEKHLSKEEWILDLGVGTGRFALPLQERGFNVAGIDISEEMLAVGASKGLQNSMRGDACLLPFKEKVFHSAISIHFLHLLPDYKNALAEVIRTTRGCLISLVEYWPNEDTPYTLYREVAEKFGHGPKHLGLHERDLPDQVKPHVGEMLGSKRETLLADERIERLENRIYSGVWKIPDDIHRKTIDEVKKRFRGTEFEVQRDLWLYLWKIDDLSKALEKLPDMSH
jgi:SAM-dependent methyltransferase